MKKIIKYCFIIFMVFSTITHSFANGDSTMTDSTQSAHDFSFKDIDGNDLPLKQFQNKVLLIVNVASKCGFTPQYQALQKLYETYADKGLEIIAVPANDFGSQEPDSCPIIKDFVAEKYKITFTMTEKYSVTGDNIHPFYEWAGDKAGFLGRPKWNFHKYLIGKNGEFIDWFSSVTAPDDKKIITEITKAL
jgi:glutathione peroxidase